MKVSKFHFTIPLWLKVYLWINTVFCVLLIFLGVGNFSSVLHYARYGDLTLDSISEYKWGHYQGDRVQLCFLGYINGRYSELYFDFDTKELDKNKVETTQYPNQDSGIMQTIVEKDKLFNGDYIEGCPVQDEKNLSSVNAVPSRNYTYKINKDIPRFGEAKNYVLFSPATRVGRKNRPEGSKSRERSFGFYIGTDPELKDERRYFPFYIKGRHNEKIEIGIYAYLFNFSYDFVMTPVYVYNIIRGFSGAR